MMISPEDVTVSIVALNGGELIGRTRLQKTAFLLEQCGMDSGLEFEYRHYGPFSADLARGCDDAEFDGRLHMAERPGSREMPYTVFTTNEPAPEYLGNISAPEVRARLAAMRRYSDIVLEVAATIVYLRELGGDPVEEVKILKPHKATERRIVQAKELIHQLGL
jgi:uncharacterized protein YwgA